MTSNHKPDRDLFNIRTAELRAAGRIIRVRSDQSYTRVSADLCRLDSQSGAPQEQLATIWTSDAATAFRDSLILSLVIGSGIPWRLVFDHEAMSELIPERWRAPFAEALAVARESAEAESLSARAWLSCCAWRGLARPLNLPREAIDVVTDWWARKLSSRQPNNRHGDTNPLAIGLESVARDAVLRQHGHPTDAELARFRAALAFAVIDGKDLMVDYDPCEALELAFGFATGWRYDGQAKLLWPFKTSMWLRHHTGSILVSDGYMAPFEVLWAEEGCPT